MGVRDLTTTQIIALFIGVVTAMGFSLGAIFSYSGMVDTGPSNQGEQEFNASLPDQNYQEEAFDLTAREQAVLAFRNDIVLVSGFYENQSQKEELAQLQDTTSEFGDRVYLSVGNSSSNSDIIYTYGLADFPRVVVIGGNRNYQGAPIQDITGERVSEEICNAFKDLGDHASKCI